MLNDQRGTLLLPLALIMLLMGFPLVLTFLNYVSTISRTEDNHDRQLQEQYAATAGIERAIFLIRYDSGFGDSMNQIEDSASDSIQVNGQTVPITVTLMELGGVIPGTEYTVQSGHQLEFKVTADADSEDDLWVVYDTVDYTSAVHLPSSTGTRTFYFHNNPTPPTGDTESQHPLPADEVAPTGTVLHNYDTDIDGDPGRMLQKSDQGAMETDQPKYQEWRTPILTSDYQISGTVRTIVFMSLIGFNTTEAAIINVYIRDLDPNASGCGGSVPPQSCYTEIGSNSFTIEPDMWGDSGTYTKTGCAHYDIAVVLGGYSIFSRITGCDGNTQILSWTAQ